LLSSSRDFREALAESTRPTPIPDFHFLAPGLDSAPAIFLSTRPATRLVQDPASRYRTICIARLHPTLRRQLYLSDDVDFVRLRVWDGSSLGWSTSLAPFQAICLRLGHCCL